MFIFGEKKLIFTIGMCQCQVFPSTVVAITDFSHISSLNYKHTLLKYITIYTYNSILTNSIYNVKLSNRASVNSVVLIRQLVQNMEGLVVLLT